MFIVPSLSPLPCACHIYSGRLTCLLRHITILQRIKINAPACLHTVFIRESNKQKDQYLSFIAIILLLSNINIRDNIIIFSKRIFFFLKDNIIIFSKRNFF